MGEQEAWIAQKKAEKVIAQKKAEKVAGGDAAEGAGSSNNKKQASTESGDPVVECRCCTLHFPWSELETGDGMCSKCHEADSSGGATSSTFALSAVASGLAGGGADAAAAIEIDVNDRAIAELSVEGDAESDAAEVFIVQCSGCSLLFPWRVLRLADGRCPSCAAGGGVDRLLDVADSTITTACLKDHNATSVPSIPAPTSAWRAARRARQAPDAQQAAVCS